MPRDYMCMECGRSYKSARSLKRHMSKAHAEVSDAEVSAESVDSAVEVEASEDLGAFSPKVLERALADLGIDADDVMASKVYPDRVVVIEGPAGYKRVWHRGGKGG